MNKLLFLVLVIFAACANKSTKNSTSTATPVTASLTDNTVYGKLDTAYMAMGCFWCVEACLERIKGVKEVVSGYAGGRTADPDYDAVGGGSTGHAEAVMVLYDPQMVSFETLLKVLFYSGDPTQVQGQGPDRGSQYRSIVFYRNDGEKKITESYIKTLNESGEYAKPISFDVVPHVRFYEAEKYHQDYEKLHPDNPYIQNVSLQRIRKVESKFSAILKK